MKPRYQICVKGYEFVPFAKKSIEKILSNKHGQKLLNNTKRSATYALK